jgi:hypothetical protein
MLPENARATLIARSAVAGRRAAPGVVHIIQVSLSILLREDWEGLARDANAWQPLCDVSLLAPKAPSESKTIEPSSDPWRFQHFTISALVVFICVRSAAIGIVKNIRNGVRD